MEKGFLHWKADILTEFDPFETGLDRFVKLEKPDFVGRDALLERVKAGPSRRLVTLAIDASDAPAHGGASVRVEDRIIGTVSSGDWGHRTGLNLAYAYVDQAFSGEATAVTVDIIGGQVPSPHHPERSL